MQSFPLRLPETHHQDALGARSVVTLRPPGKELLRTGNHKRHTGTAQAQGAHLKDLALSRHQITGGVDVLQACHLPAPSADTSHCGEHVLSHR